MKILVTGATGFIGQHLASSLLGEGHELVVLSRDKREAEKKLGLPVEHHGWDTSQLVPKECLEGVKAVVHLAGDSVVNERWTPKKKAQILQSRVQGTANLVQSILSYGTKVDTFVSASAIGFYGDRADAVLSEASAKGEGFLADVCESWEAESLKAKEKVRTTCLRIGLVLGHEGALAQLLPVFRARLGGPVGGGQQWVSWIHVEDLIGLIRHCLENSRISGALNAVAPEPVTNRTFTRALAKALGVRAVLPVSKALLRLFLGERSELVTKSQRVQFRSDLDYSFQFPNIDLAFRNICPPGRPCEETFVANQWLERSVEEVFPFFSDARNLEKITPDWLKFRVLTDVDSNIREGQHIEYRLKIHGVPVRWKSLIEQWQPNKYFVDRQVKGPYKLWHHTHTFLALGKGTLIRDQVRYEVPGGGLGNLILGPWIRTDLKRIFEFRRQSIEKIFSG